jgi:hypothetical protein
LPSAPANGDHSKAFAADDTIKIGMVLPVTGPGADGGKYSLTGAKIALDRVNKAGGVLGKQVELITEDDQTTNPGAVLAFSKLAVQADIVAFLGEVRSTQTHAMAPDILKTGKQIMEVDAETISRKAVELALGGDLTAIRLVLDRLVAPRRDRPVEIALPKIVAASDLVAATSAILEAIAEGAVTRSEAAALSTAVSGVAKAVETFELADRLAKLEEQMAAKG